MSITGSTSLSLSFQNATSANTAGSVLETVSISVGDNYANGTGANQANGLFSETITFTVSTPVTLDLTALPTPTATLSLTKVKELFVYNADTNDGHNLTVGNAASNAWFAPFDAATDTVKVPASGCLYLSSPLAQGVNPWTVDSTHKNLKLDPGANPLVVSIVIVGTQ